MSRRRNTIKEPLTVDRIWTVQHGLYYSRSPIPATRLQRCYVKAPTITCTCYIYNLYSTNAILRMKSYYSYRAYLPIQEPMAGTPIRNNPPSTLLTFINPI